MRLGAGKATAGAGDQINELGSQISALFHGDRAAQLHDQVDRRQLQAQMTKTVPQHALDPIAQHRSAGVAL